MDDGVAVKFVHAFEDALFEFVPVCDADMPEEGSGHFSEQCFCEVEP